MQCRSLNTVSTACGASFHSDCYLFTIDSAVITDKARSSVLLYLLTLVLRASHLHVVCSAFIGMLRCRDQSFWPHRVKPTLAASAFVAAVSTHTHTDTDKHTQEPHVFCSTVSNLTKQQQCMTAKWSESWAFMTLSLFSGACFCVAFTWCIHSVFFHWSVVFQKHFTSFRSSSVYYLCSEEHMQ